MNIKQFSVLHEPGQNLDSQSAAAGKNVISPKWYEAGNGDLRSALRVLVNLRQNVADRGFRDAEKWKDSVINFFGLAFYKSLTEWPITDLATVHMADHLTRHAKTFNRPLPSTPEEEAEKKRIVVDPLLSLKMAVKMIDQKSQHFEQLIRINDSPRQWQVAATMDLLPRYLTMASRELERAVNWYQELKAQGL